MKLKVNNIAKIKPSNNRVKIVLIETNQKQLDTREFNIKHQRLYLMTKDALIEYWKKKYNIDLPKNFNRCIAIFSGSSKHYSYPMVKQCIRKLRFQFLQKRRFYAN